MNPLNPQNIQKTSKIPGFLRKTYQILQNEEYQEIIGWSQEGTAFIVHKVNEFSEKVLPLYFKHHNFASFVRQLNSYGFHKSKNENEENLFRHYLFKKDQMDLLPRIKRKGKFQFLNHDSAMIKQEEGEKTGHGSGFEFRIRREQNNMQLQIQKLQKKNEALEKRLLLLVSQNCKQKKENKSLWKEIQKNKEEYNQKIEKLLSLYFFAKASMNPPQLGSPKPTEKNKSQDVTKKKKKIDPQSKKIKKKKNTHPAFALKLEQEDRKNLEMRPFEDGELLKPIGHHFHWSSSSKHQQTKTEDFTMRDYMDEYGYYEEGMRKENTENRPFILNEDVEEDEE